MTSFDQTSRIVHAARSGDPDGLGQLVERFSPWLLVQARYRLRHALRRLCEPEDLVNDVWMVALPRLTRLRPRQGRFTPVLVRFLSTTLLNRLQTLMEKHIRTRSRTGTGPQDPMATAVSLDRLPASVTDALGGASVHERQELLWATLREMEPREQRLLILRGLEQHPIGEVAALLGISPNHATVAYRRCCQKLRGRLDPYLLRDLCEE